MSAHLQAASFFLASIISLETVILHNVQTGYEAHPSSYPAGTDDTFLSGKVAVGMNLITHLYSAKVKKPRSF
jgi:hypothetical protein